MKVGTLIEWLQRFDPEKYVLFTPRNCCSGGWPEWTECHVYADVVYDDHDNATETDIVIVEISHEKETT